MSEYDNERSIDLDDMRAKRAFVTEIGSMTGMWQFAWKPYRERMSERARGYYFKVICQALVNYVRDQGEHMTKDQAHAKLKEKNLPAAQFVNAQTGEIETIPPSISRFDTAEGSEYIEKCIVWLAEMGVVVPEPSMYGGMERKKSA